MLDPQIRQNRLVRAVLCAAALVLTALLTSGCRGVLTANGDGAGRQLTVHANDSMRFAPSTLTVPAGQEVQLTLVNDGVLVHDLVLADGVEQPVRIEAGGKASASGTFTLVRPGTYTYVCAQPGHEAAGMKGTIVAR